MQHAQSDDYVEMIHELQAAQKEVQQVIPMLAFSIYVRDAAT